VVVHDETEVLVIDHAGTTRSEDLAVAGEEHSAASLGAGSAIGVNLRVYMLAQPHNKYYTWDQCRE
jgi:hypothetical protein